MATPAQNTIVLNKDTSTHIIDRNIYGHFAEHLGRCIYGGFYVGEGNKKIPNTNGVRNDVVAALKKLKIPNLRWPGGCGTTPLMASDRPQGPGPWAELNYDPWPLP